MSNTKFTPSIIEYYADRDCHSCGYCKSSHGSYSYGFWGHKLKVEDYQDLIDRGWRRSGQYCYKPIMDVTCCPMYTIRCAAKDFKISKSQKRIVKRIRQFLSSGTIEKNSKNVQFTTTEIVHHMDMSDTNRLTEKAEKYNKTISLKKVDSSVDASCKKINEDKNVDHNIDIDIVVNEKDNTLEKATRATSRSPCMKAKYLRIERKRLKLQKMGLSEEDIARKLMKKKRTPVTKTIEDFVNTALPENPAHRLEIRLVQSCPSSQEFEETYDQSFDLYRRYQMFVHKDPPDKLTHRQFKRFLVNSPLQIRLALVKSPEFDESFIESSALFAKYQKIIHKESEDECDVTVFDNFLVDSPLESTKGYGSYHQQYWLDNKLVAVGVIDILPRCVSSVYFYYDPDFQFLSFGTYGALREVVFTRSLTSQYPELLYYYMGFYIHSCVKMRYKAAFRPSYLLCPEVYSWHSVQSCLPKLNVSKYSRFNEDLAAKDPNSEISLSDVLVLFNEIAMSFSSYATIKRCSKRERDEISQYAKLVGMICARRILLYRN